MRSTPSGSFSWSFWGTTEFAPPPFAWLLSVEWPVVVLISPYVMFVSNLCYVSASQGDTGTSDDKHDIQRLFQRHRGWCP